MFKAKEALESAPVKQNALLLEPGPFKFSLDFLWRVPPEGAYCCPLITQNLAVGCPGSTCPCGACLSVAYHLLLNL